MVCNHNLYCIKVYWGQLNNLWVICMSDSIDRKTQMKTDIDNLNKHNHVQYNYRNWIYHNRFKGFTALTLRKDN